MLKWDEELEEEFGVILDELWAWPTKRHLYDALLVLMLKVREGLEESECE